MREEYDFESMNKPELLALASKWHVEDYSNMTSKMLKSALKELEGVDCVKCIHYLHNVKLAEHGFPVVSSRTGDACRQYRSMLPVLVRNCAEFNGGGIGKTRDALYRQSKRSTN